MRHPAPTITIPARKTALRSPELLRQYAGDASALLKALANEDRLILLCQLVNKRHNVGELESSTGIRQPTLSQQLAVLRQEGLVDTEKVGKYVYYHLVDDNAMRMLQTLWDIYCAPQKRGTRP